MWIACRGRSMSRRDVLVRSHDRDTASYLGRCIPNMVSWYEADSRNASLVSLDNSKLRNHKLVCFFRAHI